MSTAFWIVIAAVLVVAAIAAAWYFQQNQRSRKLQSRFGPEYDRTVRENGTRRDAEAELARREQRVSQLQIRPLSTDDRERFASEWHRIQSRFVDEPEGAVDEADRLIGDVMQRRGYPVGDFEQRAADISVDHPGVVSDYRQAHRLAQMSARGEASTEDLRQAMVYYRSLFDDLLEQPGYAPTQGGDNEVARA